MSKILFSDKYLLTKAVLEGRKTMTRRIVPESLLIDAMTYAGGDIAKRNEYIINHATFRKGEVVYIGQKYKDLYEEQVDDYSREMYEALVKQIHGVDDITQLAAYTNKMFTNAKCLLHKIQIGDMRVENLRDITDDDCMVEGVQMIRTNSGQKFVFGGDKAPSFIPHLAQTKGVFDTPRGAFACGIDSVSRRQVWKENPLVIAYSYKLVC